MIRVVHAHPVPESYSGALVAAVIDGLRTRSEPEVHRIGDASVEGPTIEELRATEELWFVHPTWWGGQPAVLVDWIQRTLGPWIDDGDRGRYERASADGADLPFDLQWLEHRLVVPRGLVGQDGTACGRLHRL